MHGRVIRDPLGHVLSGLTGLRQSGFPVDSHMLRAHTALVCLERGCGSQPVFDTLVHAYNMTEALVAVIPVPEYEADLACGKAVMVEIASSAALAGRFALTAGQVAAVARLLVIHDTCLELATVRDMERAISLIHQRLRTDPKTVRLPRVVSIN